MVRLLFIVVCCISFSCRQTSMLLLEEEPLSVSDSLRLQYLPLRPTTEPFIELSDAAFEAELIGQGLDTDNQINGKIAIADVQKATVLGVFEPSDSKVRYDLVMPLLRETYLKEVGRELKVGSLADLRHFTAAQRIYITFDYPEMDTLSLLQHPALEHFAMAFSKVKVLDLRACTNIKRVDIGSQTGEQGLEVPMENLLLPTPSSLNYLAYIGNYSRLDLSGSSALAYVKLKNTVEGEVAVLDLCGQIALRDLSIKGDARVRLSENSLQRLEASKLDSTLDYFREFLLLSPPVEVLPCSK